MGTGHFWDGTGSGNPKHSKKNVYQCHIIPHKSRMDWAGFDPGLHSEMVKSNLISRNMTDPAHRLKMDDTSIFQFSVSLQHSKQLRSLI